MKDVGLSEDDLQGIAARLAAARTAGKPPWETYLETREPIGGESFVALNCEATHQDELYFRLYLAGREVLSPDTRLDALVDLIGHSLDDIGRLLAEVHRLRDAAHPRGK